jgi:outer membrane receptor protein involved in Fe transport
LQNDWKLTPSLTLNLGARYDRNIDFLSALPDNTYLLFKRINHPITQKLLSDGVNNVEPRIGFAYDVGGNAKNVAPGWRHLLRAGH